MQTSLTSLRSFLLLSPQLLMMRIHEELYSHLKLYPRRVIIPHRLNPYPEEVQYVITAQHIIPQHSLSCAIPYPILNACRSQ